MPQMQIPRTDKRGRHVPLLMGEKMHRHPQHRTKLSRGAGTHQKAGHIRALRLLRSVRRRDRAHARHIRRHRIQHIRQLPHVMEHRIALPQTHFPRLNRQKFFCLQRLVCIYRPIRRRRGVVAGVQSQISAHAGSRATLPKTPLMNDASSCPPYLLASSTASLMDTLTGISSR